ncbi:MAG: 50S ribosomal protein L9, partial [Bacteroidales bacterium]|nr:50S ribosomal protein L9 [Bacteroidales bacterium]
VDRKSIVMKDAKELGEYTAVVKLYKEIQGTVAFTVVAETEAE